MTKLILILMAATLIRAQSWQVQAQPDTTIFVSRIVAGGGAYFIQENFENTGSPGYDLTWTESGAGFDENYTVGPLQGSESLRGSLTTFVYAYTTFTGRDSISGKFMFVLATTSGNPLITLSRVGVADDMIIYLRNASGKLDSAHGMVNGTDGATTINPGTTYWVWWTWAKGSGANGTLTVYLNTSDSKPGSPEITIPNGDGINQPTAVSFQGESGADFKVDALKLSDSAFN